MMSAGDDAERMDLPCRLAPPAYLSALPLLVTALVVMVLAVPSGPVEMRAANDVGVGSTSGAVANVRQAAGGPPGLAGFANQTAAYYGPSTAPCEVPVNHTVGWIVYNITGRAWGGTPPYIFTWSFGDGSPPGSGASVSHRYTLADLGVFNVNMTVRDAQDRQNSTLLHAFVEYPPQDDIARPWWDGYTCVGTTQVTYGALLALGFVGFWVAMAVVMVVWRKRHPRPPRPGASYVLVPVVVAPPPPPPPEPPR